MWHSEMVASSVCYYSRCESPGRNVHHHQHCRLILKFGHTLPIARSFFWAYDVVRWSGQLGRLVVLLELAVTRLRDLVPRLFAILGLSLGKVCLVSVL